jgi:hypothetical protein
MKMHRASPLDDLGVPALLVAEFFSVFGRLEYAMKVGGFCGNSKGRAVPDWKGFGKDVGPKLLGANVKGLQEAVGYLLREPPGTQKFDAGRVVFFDEPLDGYGDGFKAIDATKRVRNNLFHGGKLLPHSAEGRDKRLLTSALIVLRACLLSNDRVRTEFESY